MYVTNLFLDRFGAYSALRLDALSPGLAIVYGPTHSGKSTLIHFLQAMFGGFHPGIRDRFLPGSSRGFGGKLTIQTAGGRQSVTRYDDGGVEGRLTVEHADGSVIGCRSLRQLFGELPLAMLDTAFVVDFEQRPELSLLLERAAANGWKLSAPPGNAHRQAEMEAELHAQRQALLALPAPPESLDALTKRRQELLNPTDVPTSPPPETGIRTKLEQDAADAAQHVQSLQKEIEGLEISMAELQARRSGLPLQAGTAGAAPDAKRLRKLRALESQLARWKRTLRDVLARKLRAAEELDKSRFAVVAELSVPDDPRPSLKILAQLLEEWAAVAEKLSSPGDKACQCAAWEAAGKSLIPKLKQELLRHAQSARRQRIRQRHRALVAERSQLQRCEAELRQAVQLLSQRRRRLLAQNVHGQASPSAFSSAGSSPVRHGEWEELTQEINRLAEVRLKWLAEIDEWQAELAERRAELEKLAVDSGSTGGQDGAQLEGRQSELARIDALLACETRRRELVQSVVSLERQLEAMRGLPREDYLVEKASEFLRSLSAGQLRGVDMAPHREIQIEDAQGRSVALADLADGDRDQVYLAFCVALSANCARRGQHMPLMLNAVFNHFPAHSMRHVLEVLGEFARNHQIICFTRFEHVVETARACGIPVHHLAGGVARGSGDETEPARSDEPHVARAVASPAANIATGSQESPEELFHLHEDDPVEWTPSIGPAHAERLRKIGVLRVGDLLRVDPAEVAADLQRHGVSADLVNSWRAHARLVCSVRGLRPYDARLLVACGIRDPQQLAETPPARLRATIKEFLATTEGRELLTSGTEEELARVTEWVRQKSRSRRLPAGSDPNARTAQVAAKTRPASPRTRKGRRPARPAEINNSSKGPPQSGTAEAATIMQHPAAAPQRDGLQLSDPVRCAPSIGPVMAQRLEQVGIVTIRDLLAAQPDAVAAQVGIVRLTADTITRWQQQADLASQIPTLQEQGSQLLVGAGINSVGDLASQSPPELHVRIQRFAETVAGKRLLRSKAAPTIGEVTEWIHAARGVRSANAA